MLLSFAARVVFIFFLGSSFVFLGCVYFFLGSFLVFLKVSLSLARILLSFGRAAFRSCLVFPRVRFFAFSLGSGVRGDW